MEAVEMQRDQRLIELEEKMELCRREVDGKIDGVHDQLSQLCNDVAAIKEIVEAWNNVKGFINTITFLATTAKWIIKTIGPIAALILAIWMGVKTGNWKWKD